MKPGIPKPSCEDVLNAFAVEATHDRCTLERYLREYPEYAVEIAHLSHDLSRAPIQPQPLTANDDTAIEDGWKLYAAVSASSANLFSSLSVPQLRELATALGVPRQIITAFRERKVIVSSVPRRFLAHMATALQTSIEQVQAALLLPGAHTPARSYKAEEKPTIAAPATFEQLLIEAQVPEDKRRALLAA